MTSEEEIGPLLCLSVEQAPKWDHEHPDTLRGECAKCGIGLWISPTSQEGIDNGTVDETLCESCWWKVRGEYGQVTYTTLPGVSGSLEAWVKSAGQAWQRRN